MIKLLAGIALTAVAIQANAASVVYDQGFNPAAPVGSAPFSERQYRVSDNFTLGSDATVNTATIWGGHWSSDQFVNDSFNITISTNLGGANVFDANLAAVSKVDTGIDHNGVAAAPIYEYVFDLGNVNLLAGVAYYFSAYSLDQDPVNSFYWQRVSSNIGVSWQSGRKISGDMAFQLSENLSPVPVPAAAWLFGTALLGFAGFRHKKLKAA